MDSQQIAASIARTNNVAGPIGVFDSGYGGLTILEGLRKAIPDRDYLYLGDNARAPYGTRSFDLVYRFTLQAVEYLFARGCHLVILGCNTASAKALRTIQQRDLPVLAPERRVLGVIRPTAEAVGALTSTGAIGIVGTPGTVASHSYDIEIGKLHPHLHVYSQSCPMWVPLVENREADGDGADWFVRRDLENLMSLSPDIDTLVLGCTHYPLLIGKIRAYLPEKVRIVSQAEIVGASLADYLQRHPEIDSRVTRGATCGYLTTEDASRFAGMASMFTGRSDITAARIEL